MLVFKYCSCRKVITYFYRHRYHSLFLKLYKKVIFKLLYTFFSVNTIPKLKKRGVFLKKIKTKGKNYLKGAIIGAVNGFFGAGGGLACVPLLMKMGFERKLAHANAVAVIFPITLISAINYLWRGYVTVEQGLIYLPGGVLGALVGTYIMKKISPRIIKKVFAMFMIWAGWRLIFG